MTRSTVTLYRPVGPKELALIREAADRRFPPRLPEQPIFYPVLNEAYAEQIARDWNSKDAQVEFEGYVTRFEVDAAYLSAYEPKQVGGAVHQEYWIPAAELNRFNDHIVGRIEVVSRFRRGERVEDP